MDLQKILKQMKRHFHSMLSHLDSLTQVKTCLALETRIKKCSKRTCMESCDGLQPMTSHSLVAQIQQQPLLDSQLPFKIYPKDREDSKHLTYKLQLLAIKMKAKLAIWSTLKSAFKVRSLSYKNAA